MVVLLHVLDKSLASFHLWLKTKQKFLVCFKPQMKTDQIFIKDMQ